MICRECNLFEYAVNYQGMMDEQCGFFARIAVRNGGKILVFSEEQNVSDTEHVLGAAILNIFEPNSYDLVYLYLRPEYRGRGYAKELMQESLKTIPEHMGFSARVMTNREDADKLRALADRVGLLKSETTTIYHSYPQNAVDRSVWERFMEEKGRKICAHMEKKGYLTTDFAHAPKEILDRLQEEAGICFPAYLNPFAMITPRDDEYSFLTYKDGVVVTYNTASSYGEGKEKKVAQEMMANRYGMMRSGVFFPALVAFIDRTIERQCKRVTYTVYDSNTEMQKLNDGFLQGIIHENATQEMWRFHR